LPLHVHQWLQKLVDLFPPLPKTENKSFLFKKLNRKICEMIVGPNFRRSKLAVYRRLKEDNNFDLLNIPVNLNFFQEIKIQKI
jgi:hypothetical protein